PSAPLSLAVVIGLLALGLARRRRPRIARATARSAASLGAVVVVGAGSVISGCAVDPFCFSGCDEDRLDAAQADAGVTDAGGGGNTDGCVPSGDELCDDRDNDCDGRTDETFDLEGDPRNCGSCGHVCTLDHAFPGCTAGDCAVARCEIGWVDLDGVPANGCEYGCPPDGDELCDERDNDCDGRIDEGFDLTSEIAHCGTCDTQCQFPNGTPTCVDRVCRMVACNAGYVDADMDPSNGCEYACTDSGAETCNGADDDCDRVIDNGFDTTTDPMNCGACGRVCTFPNATGRCVASACTFGPADCAAGYYDVDGDPRTGCEYMCTPTGAADTCNHVDDDCDGAIDEADPMVGTSCGTATGACDTGTTACVRGALTCVGGVGPIAELCNAADDDCDGTTDESVPASPIPSVGDRCGATDVGACSYGMVTCTGGALVCSGAVTASAETCNGVDDDCNGALDDGLVRPAPATVPSCAEVRGICAGRTPTCRGAAGWGCDLPMLYQATETRCDTLDNDCDGTGDEGCLRALGTDTRIDTQTLQSETNSLRPVIVASGSNVQLVWTETIWRDPDFDARVFFSRSIDGGASFAAATRLNTTNGDTFGPQVLFGASNVLWAWADFRGGTGYREIWTRRSTDASGTTPAASEVRANASGATSTTDSYNVRIALAGSTIFATYEAFTASRNRHIFLTRSTDGGATWVAPVQVSTSVAAGFVAAQPRIATTSSRAYVVWRDNRSGSLDVYLRAWNVGTSAFVAAEQRMDTGTAAGSSSSFSADVAAEGTNAYVVWVDDRDRGSFDIWVNRSTDSGGTWLSSAVKLDGDPFDHDSIDPHVIAPDVGDVLVAWTDYRSGFPDPFVVRSTTAGATFSTAERVDTGTAAGASGSYDIAIAGAGNLVAIAWSDDRAGLLDVYANFSLDQGVTWQPQDYRMDSSTLGSSDSQEPTVAVAGSTVHVAWTDHRRGASCPSGTAGDPSCANGDIYYRRMQ
ncbi:MAG: glycoside hydrolase, partial [Sandaracinaceae bacterium]|nr:glycoside hydrolase [Sandaracinaceae bacterium]